MSATSTPLDRALLEYVAAHTGGDDELVRDLKEAALAEGFPGIWIAPEQASFLTILLRAARARRVLEVGTLAGVSALALARALPSRAEGGHLVTIELDPRRAAFAREWLGRSPVGDRIEVLQGAADAVLPGLAAGSFDAAFIDADKAGYGGYLEHALRLVRPGGLVLVDNAFAFGQLLDPESQDPDVKAVREFNEQVRRSPALEGIIVPIGDGLWVAVRKERGE
jgi:predicted O-methyltransferase YrrM